MRGRHLLAFLLAAFPVVAAAAFDPTDVIQIETTASLLRDNNLYRLPDVDPRAFGIEPDRNKDTVRVLGLGLKLDKTISRQRGIVDLHFTDSHYDDNPHLNNTGYNARLSWLWRFGNDWEGEIGYRRRRYLAPFAETRQIIEKDVITAQNYVASAGYALDARWRVRGTVSARDYEHDRDASRGSDFEARSAALALLYRTPLNDTFGLEVRREEGEYPNRQLGPLPSFDNNYTDTEVNGLVTWRLSDLLRLDGALGWTQRKHENVPERDFSGLTGKLSATWQPTGKLTFTLTGNRDIRNLEDVVNTFVLVNSVLLVPVWAVTSKVALQGYLLHEKREYLGDTGVAVLAVSAREDTVKLARLAVIYSPLRSVDLSLSYERGDRDSNRFLNSYDYEAWFGTLRLRF